MKTIKSFQVNHEKLEPGIYVSRVDEMSNIRITTFDLRFTRPNREDPIPQPALHTIEHLGATFLRNDPMHKKQIVYFGPMGCRTGFYLNLAGVWVTYSVLPLVRKMCNFIINYTGEIPGAKPNECGNYLEHDLEGAKEATEKYLREITENFNCEYPK